MLSFFKKQPVTNHMRLLADLLANGENRETFLGVKEAKFPTPQEIRDQSAKLARHSESSDYLTFAEEAWGRVLNHLDIMLDDRTTDQRVQYHRGALKATLDLLRVSYQARVVMQHHDKEQAETSSR